MQEYQCARVPCHKGPRLPGYMVARLPGPLEGKGVRFPWCLVRRALGCDGPRVPGCKGPRVPGCQGVKLPGCQNVGFPLSLELVVLLKEAIL